MPLKSSWKFLHQAQEPIEIRNINKDRRTKIYFKLKEKTKIKKC